MRNSSGRYVIAAAIAALCAFLSTATAAKAEDIRITPIPLRSAEAIEKSDQNSAFEGAAAKACETRTPQVQELSTLAALHSKLQTISGDGIRQALVDTGVPATDLPKNADPKANEAALEALRRKKLNELSTRAEELTRALKLDLATDIAKATAAPCDSFVCAERALRICRMGRADPLETRSGVPVTPTPGVSWLEGTAAPALANFLSERARAELELWLVETFEGEFCKAGQSTVTWFPRSCAVLGTLKEQSYQVPGTLLGSSLRSDLERLPLLMLSGRIEKSKASERNKEREDAEKKSEQSKTALVGMASLILQARDGQSPLALLAGLRSQPTLMAECAKNPSALGCLLTRIGELVELAGDAAKEYDTSNFDDKLPQLATSYVTQAAIRASSAAEAQDLARPFLQSVHALSLRLREYGSSRKEGTPDQKSSEIVSLIADVISASLALDPRLDPLKEQWKQIREALEIAAMMSSGRYTDATNALLVFADTHGIALPDIFKKYVVFAVEMASAKTVAEAEAALSAAAAPVGSWRVKRSTAFTVSVSALVGGTVGWETPSIEKSGSFFGAGSVMASVGLDFAFRARTWTVGPYVSLLDVGQLISSPIDPEREDVSGGTRKPVAGGKVQAVQVLSPGLFLRVGAGESPFTFGFGASIAPKLRKFETRTEDATRESALTVIRLSAFAAVDITLLPF